jgi:hypothetical protein
MKNYLQKILKKTMLGGLGVLTLAGAFYGSKALVEHLMPPEPSKVEIKQENNKNVIEDTLDAGAMFVDYLTALDFSKVIPKYIAEPFTCDREIKPKHSREQIEEIVNSVNTPEEAFEKIKADIKFSNESNLLGGCLLDRWMSLQETYALGCGDCMEGIINFAAMLSDNPEYDVQIIIATHKKDENDGHAIGLFYKEKPNNKWGIVSFNDERGEKRSLYYRAKYNTIKDAVSGFCNGLCKDYAIVTFSPEELKFGKALQKNKDSTCSEWMEVE